jgi:putative peptide zinc metalloprotease protein
MRPSQLGESMSVDATSQSAAKRPIRLRMRSDLEFNPQRFRGERYWAVKDPIALKYYHLRNEEFALLKMLDGPASVDALRQRLEEAFAPRRPDNLEVQGFLATLYRYGLVVADSLGQGEQLLERRAGQGRQRFYETLAGALAIRLPGINPRRMLDWLDPLGRLLFSRASVAAALVLAVAAALLVLVQFETFRARLPDFQSIVAASNLPWLAFALAATKILHEFGHGLACRRTGGDCHEIGVMLLVFTPCLYCNVSDSWMLPNKWQRIAIAAAGIYVELILASVCTFLWWFSQPGLFNSLCLNTMLVCSIGTVLLNGNPLLRYDGYYILSDLVEVPNLRAQATSAVSRYLARWLGIALADDRMNPSRGQAWLAFYAVASTVYRLMIVTAVLWALAVAARPYGLQPVVAVLTGVTLAGMAFPAVSAAVRFARQPTHRRRVAPARAALTGALFVAGIGAMAFIDLPVHVAAPVVIEYRDAESVFVTVGGTLVEQARIGQSVEQGQTLAQLDDPSVRREVARLTSDRDRQRVFLANLEARRLQGIVDGSQVPAAVAALADANARLAQFSRDAASLTIVAPVAGVVLPAPGIARPSHVTDKLDRWSGTPLDTRNFGSYLEAGTLLCYIGDPKRFEAVLHVAQSEIELVALGQRVRVQLDHRPGEIFWGTITEVAKRDLEDMPRQLAAAGDLPTRTDAQGVSRPLDTWYQVRVQFDSDPPHLVAGIHGGARISAAPSPFLTQLARWIRQTFSR